MVRTIVTSDDLPAGVGRDARARATPTRYNRELARQSRFRVDAELVRDNALAVAGLLVPKIGGPERQAVSAGRVLGEPQLPHARVRRGPGRQPSTAAASTPAGSGSFLHPSLLAFDAPSREECTAERTARTSRSRRWCC